MAYITATSQCNRRGKPRRAMFVGAAFTFFSLLHNTSAGQEPPAQTGAAPPAEPAGDERYVSRARVEHSAEQSTGFTETIDVAAETSKAGSVSDSLSEADGVQVRRLGGAGSYADVSIRGSTPYQVPVYLDGLQLNAGGFSAVDLGQLSIDSLQTMEVYRGTVPVAVGPGGIGGAVVLRTRGFERPISEAAITYGSWTTARAFALRGDKIGPINALMLFSEEGSKGDFKYLNRNGTPYNPYDDRFEPRQNSFHLTEDGLLKLNGEAGGWEWSAANQLHQKEQGLTGIESVQTRQVKLSTLRDTTFVSARRALTSSTTLGLEGGFLAVREELNDPLDELGVEQATFGLDQLGAFRCDTDGKNTLEVQHE